MGESEEERLCCIPSPKQITWSVSDGQLETDRQSVPQVIGGRAALLRVRIVQLRRIKLSPIARPTQERLF